MQILEMSETQHAEIQILNLPQLNFLIEQSPLSVLMVIL